MKADCPPCPAKLWCAFTAGKDSSTVADLLDREDRLAGVVAFDTGIRVPGWLEHVRDVSRARGWPLEIYRAPRPYESLVRRYGFPGPGQHNLFMSHLKGRAVRAFKKAHPGEVLASGVRLGESRRRFGNAQGWSRFEGVWCHAPILDWSTERVWAYVRERDLQLSPAYKTLHLSGDCLCGAFAEPEEVHLIRTFYPKVADRIADLEETVAAEGLVRWVRGRRWGGGKRGLGFTRKQTGLEAFVCGECAGA